MFMQFGFITIFVSAFPLAPLFALFNNILEIRVDSNKFTSIYRRPPGSRAENIGLWQFALEAIGLLSVVTNGLVIAFTSDFIDKMVYRSNNGGNLSGYVATFTPFSPLNATTADGDLAQVDCHYMGFRDEDGMRTALYFEVGMAKLSFFIAFEHAVFLTKFIVQTLVPDMPKWLVLERKRELYAARDAIEGALDDSLAKGSAAKAGNGKAKQGKDAAEPEPEEDVRSGVTDSTSSEKFLSPPSSPIQGSKPEDAVGNVRKGQVRFLPPGRSDFSIGESSNRSARSSESGPVVVAAAASTVIDFQVLSSSPRTVSPSDVAIREELL
jgi:hypothetical protein